MNIVLFRGLPKAIALGLLNDSEDTVSCLSWSGSERTCPLHLIPFIQYQGDWIDDLSHLSAQHIAYGPRLRDENNYAHIVSLLKARRTPRDTEALCNECADRFDWSIFPWSPRDSQQCVALVTKNEMLVNTIIENLGCFPVHAAVHPTGMILSIIRVKTKFLLSFNTAMFTEPMGREGEVVWDEVVAQDVLPYLVYRRLDHFYDRESCERWKMHQYEIIDSPDGINHTIYRPQDKQSFLGMCRELKRGDVDWLSVVSGRADVASVGKIVEECETQLNKVLIYDIRSYDEYKRRVPWFYAPGRGFGELLEMGIFVSAEAALVGRVAAGWSNRYAIDPGRCDLF